MNKIYFFLLFLILQSHAVSFDCKKAFNFDEKLICNDSELSRLDTEMSLLYTNLISEDQDNKANIKLIQKNWLRKRMDCKNVNCLKSSYYEQISLLSKYNKKFGERHTNTENKISISGISIFVIFIWSIIAIKLSYVEKDLNGAVKDKRFKIGWRNNLEPNYVKSFSFFKYICYIFAMILILLFFKRN